MVWNIKNANDRGSRRYLNVQCQLGTKAPLEQNHSIFLPVGEIKKKMKGSTHTQKKEKGDPTFISAHALLVVLKRNAL